MIIIPDVHGRDFWRKPVEESLGKEPILFLGDYLDPYPGEGIAPWDVLPGFEDIIEVKRSHPDSVTLLLGNHDLHYLPGVTTGGRKSIENADTVRRLILDNADLFQMAHVTEAGGRRFLFTHAGLLYGWLVAHRDVIGTLDGAEAAARLNAMWADPEERPTLFRALNDIPYSRWGRYLYGSPVWNDVEDMDDSYEELSEIYQIFGHTQQEFGPIICEHFACLDCRRAFRLSEDGSIYQVDISPRKDHNDKK